MGWLGDRFFTWTSLKTLVCFAVVGVIVAPTSVFGATECAAVDARLDSNAISLADAAAAYEAILATTPNSACATEGHKAATDFLAAEKLDSTGLVPEAASLIADALKVRPQTPIPAPLMPESRATRAYKTALALERRAYHDAAVATLERAIAAYPGYPPDQVLTAADAKALTNVRPPHQTIWQLEPWASLLDWAIGLVAIILTGLVLWRLALWTYRFVKGGRLLIPPFQTTGGTGTTAATSGTSADGKGFAAVVGDYIHRLGSISGVEGPDRVSKWGDPMTFPTEISAVPQVGVITALLTLVGRLIPSRDRSLVGLLHADLTGTVGVSLTLEDRLNKVLDDRPIWSGDFGLKRSTAVAPIPPAPGHVAPSDRPELLYPLAYPVAVWAFWNVVQNPERLGTTDWQSYALFGIGEEFDSMGQSEDAERSYLEALSLDPENKPALINLANLILKSH